MTRLPETRRKRGRGDDEYEYVVCVACGEEDALLSSERPQNEMAWLSDAGMGASQGFYRPARETPQHHLPSGCVETVRRIR